ncbi:hypothetical protein ACK31J_17505 [Aeromonas caviae]
MFTELSLEHRILKNIVEKVVKPAIRRELVEYGRIMDPARLGLACLVVGIGDSVYRFQPKANNDNEVTVEPRKAAERYPSHEFS